MKKLAIVLAVLAAGLAQAQQYPDRPVTVPSGFLPGGMATPAFVERMTSRAVDIDYRSGEQMRA